MEALGLGLFMISAGVFGTILEYPGSSVHQAISSALARRVLMGLAMGLTAIGLAYSPWGRRSGAHINPAFTWTFFRLGRVNASVALLYTVAQFAGGLGGVAVVAVLFGDAFLGRPVEGVATLPSAAGISIAFTSELVISTILMLVVLTVGGSKRLGRYTALFVGALLVLYITFEAPMSGMSMNPARTFASALPVRDWRGIWIYFTAPPLGMLCAAEIYLRASKRGRRTGCAKIVHHFPCIFCGGKATPVSGAPRRDLQFRASSSGSEACSGSG